MSGGGEEAGYRNWDNRVLKNQAVAEVLLRLFGMERAREGRAGIRRSWAWTSVTAGARALPGPRAGRLWPGEAGALLPTPAGFSSPPCLHVGRA